MVKNLPISIVFLFLFSCVGYDELDNPIVGESIILEDEQVAITKGESYKLTPMYYDQYGIGREVSFDFTSSDVSIATVDNNGNVLAVDSGTAFIEVDYMGIVGAMLQVNVPNSNEDVALVRIFSPTTILNPNQSFQMTIEVMTIEGTNKEDEEIMWFSENSNIAEVSQTGILTAKSVGKVDIHAKVNGVKSNVITITVEDNIRVGTFVPSGGYQAKGTVTLERVGGRLMLNLEEDFVTSFALGTYIYLANSTNGGQVRVSGIEIAEIKENGAHTFDLTAKFPDLRIRDFEYVIVLCKPASVTFGFAKLS